MSQVPLYFRFVQFFEMPARVAQHGFRHDPNLAFRVLGLGFGVYRLAFSVAQHGFRHYPNLELRV